MKINRIKINGFKNIVNADIVFDKITSLLSVNSYGKSNMLTAIDYGIYFIRVQKERKNKLMNYANAFPLNKLNINDNFEYEIELTIHQPGAVYSIIYSYSFEWKSLKEKNRGIIAECLKIKKSDELKYSTYILRDESSSKYKSSVTGRCDKDIIIENDELILNKINNFDDLFYINIIKQLNSISVYYDRHFDSSSLFTPSPLIEKNIDDLTITNEKNIPRVLHNIKVNYPNKYKKIINAITSIFPFISDLKIKEIKIDEKNIQSNLTEDEFYQLADKVYILYAIDKNLIKSIAFNQMSDGVKRVLLVLTYIVLAEINNISLIAIEEPENSINPGLLKKYLLALDSFLDNTKVLISSHSPYLINYIDPNSLYIGLPNNDGLAIFKKVKNTSVNKLYKDSNDLDMLVGEYLFDLLSENASSSETIKKYLNND